MTEVSHRSGFVALVGRPNVGKSTLLNALLEQKLSIVSPKPQTTRHRILGLLNRANYQIALVDTPGLHLGGKRMLNSVMNRTAASSLADADLVAFVVEALRFTEEDENVLQRIQHLELPSTRSIGPSRVSGCCRTSPIFRRYTPLSMSSHCRRSSRTICRPCRMCWLSTSRKPRRCSLPSS